MADVKHSGASLYVEGHSDSSVGYRNDNDVIWEKNTRRNGRIGDGANDAYKVFGEMSSIKFIKQDGSVREYYDEFISYHNACISWTKKMGQSEECLVSLFMSGLKPEIEKMVYFRPKTLHSAYLLANLQEATNELIEKKSNATTPMSSSSKINLSKEVEKVNSELVGYHECCKANEKKEEIECMGLIAFDNSCEENVEGVDMELDDKCFEVIDNFVNKDDESDMCDLGIEKKSEDGMVSLDSSKYVGTGEEISKDIKTDSKNWVACDSRCEESEIINGRMIQDDTVSDVPSLFQSTHDEYKFLTLSGKEKCNNDFKKENGSSFVGLAVTRTIVEKTMASTKMIQEKNDIFHNQNKMNNSEVKKSMKRWDTKTSVNAGHQTQSGLSLKHSKWITTMCNNYNITLSRRVGVFNMIKMGAFDTSLLQKSVKEATKKEPSFDHLMFDTWKWLNRKRKCQKMRQAVALRIYFSELFSKVGCGVKTLMFKEVLKVIKGWLSVVTQKFEVQEAVMLVVITKCCNVAFISTSSVNQAINKVLLIRVIVVFRQMGMGLITTEVHKINGTGFANISKLTKCVLENENFAEGEFVLRSIQYGDGKLYQHRKWMEDSGKGTCGLEFDTPLDVLKEKLKHLDVKSVIGHSKFLKNEVSLGYEKFDMWKWPTRKKIDGTLCKVKHRKREFDIWKWPKRKKKRKVVIWYGKMMFECGSRLVGLITFGRYVCVHDLGFFGKIPKVYVFNEAKEITKDQVLEQIGSFLKPRLRSDLVMEVVHLGIQ
ncbi:mitochondrial translation elongation factor G [Tanacetum coccineum]